MLAYQANYSFEGARRRSLDGLRSVPAHGRQGAAAARAADAG